MIYVGIRSYYRKSNRFRQTMFIFTFTAHSIPSTWTVPLCQNMTDLPVKQNVFRVYKNRDKAVGHGREGRGGKRVNA